MQQAASSSEVKFISQNRGSVQNVDFRFEKKRHFNLAAHLAAALQSSRIKSQVSDKIYTVMVNAGY